MKSKTFFLTAVFTALVLTGFAQEEIISLNFKDTDIHIVLQALAEKSGVNVVATPEVQGTVSIQLKDVPWATALDVLLKTYGYGYEYVGEKIVMVDTLESLATKREADLAAKAQEPLETITYKLKYLNASDVKRVIEPQLTPRGRISVLEVEYQKGWRSRGGVGQAGKNDFQRAERLDEAQPKSKTLIVTDTQTNIRSIVKALDSIDVMPRQVLIEARIMEVNRDKLEDLGVDWGTGNDVVNGTLTPVGGNSSQLGVLSTTSVNSPSPFIPKASLSGTVSTAANAFDSGLSLLYQKLSGTEFQVLIHALEEEVSANTLSAPRVLTLDGQEAYIMVGLRQPLIESELTPPSDNSAAVISKKLKEYQPLGIELNVLPQICGDGLINMIIYPSVTSSPGNVDAVSVVGSGATAITSTDSYPIILVRETQTQVLVKDGETIVIGGLLKDVVSKGLFKVPLLASIPGVGKLFQRETEDIEKIDLVIFITARILNPGDSVPDTAFAVSGDVLPVDDPLQATAPAVVDVPAVAIEPAVEPVVSTEAGTGAVAEEAQSVVPAVEEVATDAAVEAAEVAEAVPVVEEATVPAAAAVKDARAYELYQENRAVLDAADAAIGRADRLK